ncbi:MAG: hypothetical protein IAF08_07845 [Rhizobacter sp.]|nr:hypothetical protein [Chlorobiales bacterium]
MTSYLILLATAGALRFAVACRRTAPLLMLYAVPLTSHAQTKSAAKEPIAYLGGIEGKVEIISHGKAAEARTAQPLYDGDEIRTAVKSTAIVISAASKTELILREKSSVVLTKPAKKNIVSRLFAVIFNADTNSKSIYAAALMVRSEAAKENLLGIRPDATAVLAMPDSLCWTRIEGAERYAVRLTDASGNTVLTATTSSAVLATAGKKLTDANTYFLQVAAYQGETLIVTSLAKFTTLSAAERAAIEEGKGRYAEHPFMLAAMYDAYGLYCDAAKACQRVLVTEKENKFVRRLLAASLYKQGRYEQAKLEFAKAE